VLLPLVPPVVDRIKHEESRDILQCIKKEIKEEVEDTSVDADLVLHPKREALVPQNSKIKEEPAISGLISPDQEVGAYFPKAGKRKRGTSSCQMSGDAASKGAKQRASDLGPLMAYKGPSATQCCRVHQALVTRHGPHPRPTGPAGTVLDALVRTILSQNTTDVTSLRAFQSLKRSFRTYRQVLEASPNQVAESIRCGGLADIKVQRIRSILEAILKERPKDCQRGEPSMEYLRKMPTNAVIEELSKFKGVGPKTISCVLLFAMGRNDFPVDTHVWHIAKRLGWVPPSAGREETYKILNRAVPDDIKYELHVLFVEHGKKCVHCARNNKTSIKGEKADCPLSAMC